MGEETGTFGSATENDSTTAPLQSSWEIASQGHWVFSVIWEFLIIFANSWIAVTFIHHAVSTKVLKRKKSRRDVNGGMVLVLAITAVTMPFIRYSGTLFLLFVSLYPEYEEGCETANDLCIAGFGLALLPTYCFLWARQRAFYGHPSLGNMFGACVSVFSNISLILIVLTAIAALALGIYPQEYNPGPGGCVLIGGEETDEWRSYIYFLVMISSQLILLGLFLHPIRIHAQNQGSFDASPKQNTRTEMSELSTDGFTSSVAYRSGSDEGNHNNTAYNVTEARPDDENKKDEETKPNRSMSVPTNRQLRFIAKDLEPHRRYSAEASPNHDGPPRASTVNCGSDVDARKTKGMSGIKKSVSNFTKRIRRQTMRSKKIYRLIKRVLILAVISIASDLLVMMVNQFLIPDDIPQTYAFVMYDMSILINVVTVVLSFENWRKRMMSPCGPQGKR